MEYVLNYEIILVSKISKRSLVWFSAIHFNSPLFMEVGMTGHLVNLFIHCDLIILEGLSVCQLVILLDVVKSCTAIVF